MASFKQNKFYKNSGIKNSFADDPLEQRLTPSQINSHQNDLSEGEEAIRWERIGLLEDCFVQIIGKRRTGK
ncbi:MULTISPECIES: hypothetical protein [unclassified Prochlorococcus]|uniref:hypothetical protein n=1 Tax=unclassified Prochlorococcus TaxID=2627481 RepID=UPI0005337E76|nr:MULTISPECIES: hypothetical protein [unclassified Prochlorococcus]KGG16106.1 hypothetical protein EV06_0814 [Prochlorococcus sp. MIT 0602]KGG17226.1 hypothetical protein EV07_0662 [Prochlorococcus sp. MIT 0603]